MKYIELANNMHMVDEGHLGGFIAENDPATFTPNLWQTICLEYNIKSVIDVGCGMGYAIGEMLKFAECVGIDGSTYVQYHSKWSGLIELFDFSIAKYLPTRTFDLAWSSEFLEHVEEKYIENYIEIFKNSQYAAITYADIGQDGHHHVNCQPKQYWIDLFESHGLQFLDKDTENLKTVAKIDGHIFNPKYNDNHFYNRGLFFKNKNI